MYSPDSTRTVPITRRNADPIDRTARFNIALHVLFDRVTKLAGQKHVAQAKRVASVFLASALSPDDDPL